MKCLTSRKGSSGYTGDEPPIEMDAVVTKITLRLLSIAALTFTGVSQVQAQTVMELKYPSNAPGVAPCVYTTDGAGLSADPATGRLLATGDFGTGCPQTGTALPLPVIVPGPLNWVLPNPWTVGTSVAVQWAAVNAATCSYTGSAATGWPSGTQACAGSACQSLKNVTLTPTVAGTYTFSMNCVNETGTTTSTSTSAVVSPAAVINPTISAGPGTWGNLLPWAAGGSKSVSWAASNADSCALTGSFPSGVTLASFVSGSTSCSSASGCASAHPLTLTAAVAGTYNLSLTCTNNAGGGPVISSNTWTVSPASTGSCATVGSFARKQTANIFYNNSSNTIGNFDVTTFESLWGRDYPSSANPNASGNINATWPGNTGLATAEYGNGEYLSLKFRTPNVTTWKSSQLSIDGTTFSFAGGGTNSTMAKMSMTVSKSCGDFNTASADIPVNCYKSQMGAGGEMKIVINGSVNTARCVVQPNTDYYLNIIFAPLTSPASAVYNGVGGIVQIRNFPEN